MFIVHFSSKHFKSNFLFVLINRFIKHSNFSLNLKIKFNNRTRSCRNRNDIKKRTFMIDFHFSKINTKIFVYQTKVNFNSRFTTNISYINIFYENYYQINFRSREISKSIIYWKVFFVQILSSYELRSRYIRVQKLTQQLTIVLKKFIDLSLQMHKKIHELFWRHDFIKNKRNKKLIWHERKYDIYNNDQS